MISTNRPAGWEPVGAVESSASVGRRREPYRLAGDAIVLDEPLPQPEALRLAVDHTPTVLVVEDDEPTRLAMASWLSHEGYLVLTAANGHEAAVLDVGLPDVDGIRLCERLRQMYPTMPVVVCSGQAAPAEVARLVELGASRYFRKPVEPDELLSAVESSLP